MSANFTTARLHPLTLIRLIPTGAPIFNPTGWNERGLLVAGNIRQSSFIRFPSAKHCTSVDREGVETYRMAAPPEERVLTAESTIL